MMKARMHYNQGNALRAEGKDEQAIKEYQKALTLDPSFWLARKSVEFLRKHLEKKHASFGSLYESEGNFKEAIQEYKKACEVNPSSWRIPKKIALLYLELQEFDKALRTTKKAIKAAPTTADLYFILGKAYDLKENYGEALKSYDLALRFSPHNKELIKQKKLTQKMHESAHSVKPKTKSPSVYIDIASLFLEKDMPKKAISLLKRGVNTFPRNQEIHFTLGNVYYSLSDFKMACRLYKKTLHCSQSSIHPEEIHYNIGLALASQEKWKEAIAAWKCCINLAPRSRAALRAKANLELLDKKKYPRS